MQKVEPKTVGVKPTKIGHVDRELWPTLTHGMHRQMLF